MYTPEVVSDRHINLSIVTAHLPEGADGIVTLDRNNNYMIIVNADLPEDKQTKAFLHECLHIWNRDFERTETESVGQIEARTHRQIEQFLS